MNITTKSVHAYAEPMLVTFSGFATGFSKLRVSVSAPRRYVGEFVAAGSNIVIDVAPIARLVEWTGAAQQFDLMCQQQIMGQWGSPQMQTIAIKSLRSYDTLKQFIPQPVGPNAEWLQQTLTPPPSRIIASVGTSNDRLGFEYVPISWSSYVGVKCADENGEYTAAEVGNMSFSSTVDGCKYLANNSGGGVIECDNKDCDKMYAQIQWLGHFGGLNSALWEVRNLKWSAVDVQSLDALEGYYSRKGAEVSFTAHLDGLTAYDYWVYSSIITSSSNKANTSGYAQTVRVRIDDGVWTDAEVTTKDVTIPNSDDGARHTLDVNVKLIKYAQV